MYNNIIDRYLCIISCKLIHDNNPLSSLVVFGFAQWNLPPLKIERTAISAASITSTVVARRLWLAYTWDSVNSLLISDIIRPTRFRTRGMLSYHTSTVGFLEGCWNKNTHLGFSFFLQCTNSQISWPGTKRHQL